MNLSFIERKWLDVAYTEFEDSRKLDIYLPGEGNGPFPALVWIHGGGWMGGDKGEPLQLDPLLACLDRGYALVSVNYRLSTIAKYPSQLLDVKAALRFIWENCGKYPIQKDCTGLWGGSAGGHLAALAASTEDCPDVRAVCIISAVTDLYDFAVNSGSVPGYPHPPADYLLGLEALHSKEAALAASAITHISPRTPPFYICHGTLDTIVEPVQSIRFAKRLGQVIGNRQVRLSLINGAGHHGDPALLPPEEITAQLDFFDQYLK